ncbi:hypothetical protein [Kribbella sp. NPDC003557]|jgi:hypothetical protein|uniref:hypothetical protein n=1 Tax=Kribbella sp. NPDC003557 TaxID=3154449 RepID=UPI0033B75EEF
MLIARTLREADIYVALTRAQAEPEPGIELGPAPVFEVGVNLAEGPDAWTYASPVGEITIPYSSERSATTSGAHWGLGQSQLVDAAEWTRVGQLHWDRGTEADMAYDGEPGQERYYIELNFELAAEAIAEAIKFLPDGADRVPDSAIWTKYGADILADDPNVVTRARLEDDLETYRGTLADFRALYSDS